jgi:hypothetical protein
VLAVLHAALARQMTFAQHYALRAKMHMPPCKRPMPRQTLDNTTTPAR